MERPEASSRSRRTGLINNDHDVNDDEFVVTFSKYMFVYIGFKTLFYVVRYLGFSEYQRAVSVF